MLLPNENSSALFGINRTFYQLIVSSKSHGKYRTKTFYDLRSYAFYSNDQYSCYVGYSWYRSKSVAFKILSRLCRIFFYSKMLFSITRTICLSLFALFFSIHSHTLLQVKKTVHDMYFKIFSYTTHPLTC